MTKSIYRENFNPVTWVWRFKRACLNRPNFLQNSLLWCFRQASLSWFILPIIVRHKNGFKFYLSKDAVDDLILMGICEQLSDLYFPQSLVAPYGAWFLDIGAHHGFYTISALAQYPGINVISVEPDPESLALLKRNLEINNVESRVEVISSALGRNDSEGWLQYSDGGSWGNYLGELGDSGIKVPILGLKTVLGERIPFLVKCNCEGGEFDIIPAMLELNILPEFILLFVHSDRGDEKELMQTLNFYDYDSYPLHSSLGHPRYICKRKH